MDFTEHYRIKEEARDVRCHEKSISSKIYQQWYVYLGFVKVTPVTSKYINNGMFIKDL